MPGLALIVIGVLGVVLLAAIFLLWRCHVAALLSEAEKKAAMDVLDQTTARLEEVEAESDKLQTVNTGLTARNAALETQLEHERKTAVEKLELIKQAEEKMRETFDALSATALRQNNQSFIDLAKTHLEKLQEGAKGDLEKRQESIKGLVEPLKQQLESYQKNLQQSSAAQSSTLGEVKKQLELLSLQSASLASETQQFRMVLHSNQARGKWGEETLRRVVEAAEMSPHCDFCEQMTAGENRPDLIVKLPGERVIIVDAKVPDFDFLNALETADATKRADSLVLHSKKLKETIRALADKNYPRQFANALDHVVLFLPAESLFSAALEGDRDLIVWAAQRQILLATPASLIALLRSVAVSWQQNARTENAQKIAESAQEFYARVVKFTEHFEKIRSGLDRANSAFNDAAASFQTRVRPAGERLAELGGANSAKELADIQPLDSTLRIVGAQTTIPAERPLIETLANEEE